jgi:hypothetical protein
MNNTVTFETAPRHCTDVLVQQVKGDDAALVLLDPKSGEYYTLEDVAARVWQLCDGERTIRTISETLSGEFEAPSLEIERDVVELIRELANARLPAPAR